MRDRAAWIKEVVGIISAACVRIGLPEPVNATSPPADVGKGSRPQSTAWISEDLLRSTRRVWSKVYRRPVNDEEAIEILTNVKRFAEAAAKATEGVNRP